MYPHWGVADVAGFRARASKNMIGKSARLDESRGVACIRLRALFRVWQYAISAPSQVSAALIEMQIAM
jgi:hypothetical protein